MRADDGTVVASFSPGKGGEGTVTFESGQALRWGPIKTGTAQRAFRDAAGQRIVRFWNDWHLFKVEDCGAADLGMAVLPEFPLLVLLKLGVRF